MARAITTLTLDRTRSTLYAGTNDAGLVRVRLHYSARTQPPNSPNDSQASHYSPSPPSSSPKTSPDLPIECSIRTRDSEATQTIRCG